MFWAQTRLLQNFVSPFHQFFCNIAFFLVVIFLSTVVFFKMNSINNCRYCRFCSNHGVRVPVNGHRGNCAFSNCICSPCQTIRQRNYRDRERRIATATTTCAAAAAGTAVVLDMVNNQPQTTPKSAAAKRAGKKFEWYNVE